MDSFIWLSSTNVEEGWYHNLIKDLTDKAKEETSDRGQRKIEREKTTKRQINKLSHIQPQ